MDSVERNGPLVTYNQAHGNAVDSSPAAGGAAFISREGIDCATRIRYTTGPSGALEPHTDYDDDWNEVPWRVDEADLAYRLFCAN